MQENLIKLHSIIFDGDLTEAAKLCDELIAAHQQGVQPELFCIDRETLADIFSDAASVHGEFEKTDNLLSYLQCCLREHEHKATHPTTQGLDAQDATRYRALCSSGAYAPSSFRSAPWGLVTGNTQSQSKAVLDAAVDAYITAQAEQGE